MGALCNIWRCIWGPPRSKSTETIFQSSLHTLLMRAFPGAKFNFTKEVYRLCSRKDIERFVAWDRTDKIKYEREKYRCADYAFRLLGQVSIPGWSDLAIGFVWTNVHALNCILDENMDFWYVEPQTDELSMLHLKGQTVEWIVI